MSANPKLYPEAFLASPLLSGLEDSSRRAILGRLVEGRMAAGNALLAQGRPNDKLWFVLSGTVAIDRKQANGRTDRLASMSAPGVFGTTTFFRSVVPTASIRATSELTFWTLDREGLEGLRGDDPRASEALAIALLRVLGDHFDMLDVKLAELMDQHGDDHPRANEWAKFRTQLFEEPAL